MFLEQMAIAPALFLGVVVARVGVLCLGLVGKVAMVVRLAAQEQVTAQGAVAAAVMLLAAMAPPDTSDLSSGAKTNGYYRSI